MVFYITIDQAKSITQQDKLRSVARALSQDWEVLHYDDGMFILYGEMPIDGHYIADEPDNLYLVNPLYHDVIMSSHTYGIIESSEPMAKLMSQYGRCYKLRRQGIKF